LNVFDCQKAVLKVSKGRLARNDHHYALAVLSSPLKDLAKRRRYFGFAVVYW